MTGRMRIAWTIARRDYVAAVSSRLFLFFLVLPLVFGLIGGVLGRIQAGDGGDGPAPIIAVAGDAATFDRLAAARGRLIERIPGFDVPALVRAPAEGAVIGALSGGIDRPRLAVAADAPPELAGQIALIVADAQAGEQSRVPALEIVQAAGPVSTVAETGHDGQVALAKAAQYLVLVLTVMLAGRLLSSFVEEKSNKVIEVLAAAAPVDAIFAGKLAGMLLFAFTCIAAWTAILLAATLAIAPHFLAHIPVPAVGWAVFGPLVLLYLTSSFLLLGAIMLGIGAQASSPADIQTLALPTTLLQLVLFGFASFDAGRPDHWVGRAAAIFPWSSSLAMIPRAAELPALLPHLVALAWQAAWLFLSVRFAAKRFRAGVLNAGGGTVVPRK
jgi:ABC-2 type transport system permease protein